MFKKSVLLILLSLVLSSCHFQLRGPMDLAQPLHNIYVESRDPYGDLTRNLKQYLKMSGVHLRSRTEGADTILRISQESTSQDLLSINSSQQTRQYNLKLLVTFEVLNRQGKTLIPAQTVIEMRPLTLQSNQVLAGSNQAAQLYFEMRRAIVYSIMTRLASPEARIQLEAARRKTS